MSDARKTAKQQFSGYMHDVHMSFAFHNGHVQSPLSQLDHIWTSMRKQVYGDSDQVKRKPVCSATNIS